MYIFQERAAASLLHLSVIFFRAVMRRQSQAVSTFLGAGYGRAASLVIVVKEPWGWSMWKLEGAVWIWAEHGFHLPKES